MQTLTIIKVSDNLTALFICVTPACTAVLVEDGGAVATCQPPVAVLCQSEHAHGKYLVSCAPPSAAAIAVWTAACASIGCHGEGTS